MTRYPFHETDPKKIPFLTYRIVVPSADVREQFVAASDYFHWLAIKVRGRRAKGNARYRSLNEQDFMALNALMHDYLRPEHIAIDANIPAPYVLTGDEYTRHELLEASAFLDAFAVKMKGKGTRKPGSVRVEKLDQTLPGVAFWCSLHRQPARIILSNTPLFS